PSRGSSRSSRRTRRLFSRRISFRRLPRLQAFRIRDSIMPPESGRASSRPCIRWLLRGGSFVQMNRVLDPMFTLAQHREAQQSTAVSRIEAQGMRERGFRFSVLIEVRVQGREIGPYLGIAGTSFERALVMNPRLVQTAFLMEKAREGHLGVRVHSG